MHGPRARVCVSGGRLRLAHWLLHARAALPSHAGPSHAHMMPLMPPLPCSALDSDARHVPFRGSKLTAVLKDSFIGERACVPLGVHARSCTRALGAISQAATRIGHWRCRLRLWGLLRRV